MKKIIYLILLVAVSGIWLFISFVRYQGLNSLQDLVNYNSGLLALKSQPSDKDYGLIHPGTESRIEIDTLDIPHIFGKDLNSVAFSIGYMHAKDRYFQMELTINTVMGKLSGMIGGLGLNSDRHWVRFELEAKAKAYLDSLERLDPKLYSYLKSYEEGVNYYLSGEKIENRDPMYCIWHCSPKPWKAYYVFLIQWYMSSELAFYDDYIDRQEILDKLPESLRIALYPVNSENQPTIIPGEMNSNKVTKEKNLVTLFGPNQINNYPSIEFNRNLGSNNWVVGRTITQNDHLYLANDLHLFLAAPNLFYELHLKCAGLNAYGFSIPGVPLILTGHNERISWGITNGGWDVTEQYLLKINPDNENQYWLNGKWQDMASKKYLIAVKDGPSEQVTTKYTIFGPLVKKDSLNYGLKWYPAASGHAVQSFWKLLSAENWNDFKNALRTYDYPSQNFVYGDVNGNIGMICAGKMPIKPAGYGGGMFDGTISSKTEFIEFDSLPQSFNPKIDYLFSANQEPERGTHFYSSRWCDDLSRPGRINDLLSEMKGVSLEDMRLMQLDVNDKSVDKIKSLLDKYSSGDKLSENWQMMKNWNGSLLPGQQQSIFYKCFRQAFWIESKNLAKTIRVKAPPGYDQFISFLINQDTLSVASQKIPNKYLFEEVIRKTDSIYSKLSNTDKTNSYSFEIPQQTYLPGLDIPVNDIGGSENTINVNYNSHPVIRTLIDVDSNGIQSWMINATGQTGRINEKNYFQQFNSWKINKLHKTQFVNKPESLKDIKRTIVISSTG